MTIGDPSGIGPAIIPKALSCLKGKADFLVIGDRWVLERLANVRFGLPAVKFIDLHNVGRRDFRFGQIKGEYGRASIEYIDKALELITGKEIDCLVTCPISKEAVNKGGVSGFFGHTEYLADAVNTRNFAMMLLNKKLRISLATRHIPLKDVSHRLSKGYIRTVIALTYSYLKDFFGIRNPRLVTCGVNPHASDNGLIGREEIEIIRPALKAVAKEGAFIDGPLPADTAIARAVKGDYDAVIAMYHDQALIPLKLLSRYPGVNLTLGLPFVRTSPLHGTAFDIAAKPQSANPASLIEAIRLAIDCVRCRRTQESVKRGDGSPA